MAAYALVSSPTNNNNSLPLPPPPPSPPPSSSEEDSDTRQDIQKSLSLVYSTYAQSYPNPSLLQERFHKQKLLQQIKELNAAATARSSALNSPPARSFFSFLFGGGGSSSQQQQQPPPPPVTTTEEEATKDQVEYYLQEVVPEKTTEEEEEEEEEEGWLDWDCIPEEACMMARFHLASIPRRSCANTIRGSSAAAGGGGDDGVSSSKTTKGVILDLGLIGEFQTNNNNNEEEIVNITETSDRDTLLSSYPNNNEKTLEYVRSTFVGNNMLAVSWGQDNAGLVILYRRVFIENSNVGWDAVVKIGVSGAVMDAASQCMTIPNNGVGLEDTEEKKKKRGFRRRREEEKKGVVTVESTGLVRVTDILPLIVVDEKSNDSSATDDKKAPPPTATLAVSRLGGYLELVPLPLRLWYGPILTVHSTLSRHLRNNPHLTNPALLPDLSTDSKIAALSTSLHHLDIMTLDCKRTNVGSETEWDCERYPDGPPAEFILAAVGSCTPPIPPSANNPNADNQDQSMQMEDATMEDEEEEQHAGGSCVTLWGVSTVYDENHREKSEEDISFHVHVGFLSRFELENVGPGVTLFVNPLQEEEGGEGEGEGDMMAKLWRKEKQFTIRQRIKKKIEDRDHYQEEKKEEDERDVETSSRINHTTATLSTEAPITSLFFSTAHTINGDNNTNDGDNAETSSSSSSPPLLLAGLDYNGGISILDCTSVSLSATHDELGAAKATVATTDAVDSIKAKKTSKQKNGTKKQNEEEEDEDDDLSPPSHAMEMMLLHPRERMLILNHQFNFLQKKKKKKKKNRKRKNSTRMISSSVKMDPVIHATWWHTFDYNSSSEKEERSLPLLATITSCGTFTLWSLFYHDYPQIVFQTSVKQEMGWNGNTVALSRGDGTKAIFPSAIHYGSSLPFLYQMQTNDASAPSPSSLLLCSIQKVEPKTLISSLIQQHQYKEALSMANQFHYQDHHGTEDEQAILDCCYKHFWESNHDLKMLMNVKDDGYVIDVALGLEEHHNHHHHHHHEDGAQWNIELEDVRDIWREGLTRTRRVIEENREESITLASYDYEQHDNNSNNKYVDAMEYVASKLQSNIIRLGTYILLSHRVHGSSASTNMYHFLTKFIHISIKDLAVSIAKRGDVDSLTMLLIRHANILQFNEVRMEILDVLPLGLTIELGFVQHLLPCCSFSEALEAEVENDSSLFVLDPPNKEIGGKEGPPVRFLKVGELAYFLRDLNRGIVESSVFGGYGTGRSRVTLFTDELDEEEVLLCASSLSKHHSEETNESTTMLTATTTQNDVANWYYDRAIALHKFTGQLRPVMELCTLGLDRLGARGQRRTELNNNHLRKLHNLRAQAFHLNQLLMDDILPSAPLPTSYSSKPSLSEELTLEQFESLGLEGVVPLILGGGDNSTDDTNDANEIVLRHQRYLRPMVEEDNLYYMSCWEEENEDVCSLRSTLERCITSTCLTQVRNAISTIGRSPTISSPKLQRALSLCFEFASASRTTIQRNDRVVQTPNLLIQFIIDVIVMTSGGGSGGGSASFSVLESFWNLYECLPLRVPSLEEKDEMFAALQLKVDRLYIYLIIIDILSKWCRHGSSTFPISFEAIHVLEEGSEVDSVAQEQIGTNRALDGDDMTPYSRFIALGCKVIAAASEGFCRRVHLLSMLPPEQRPKQQHELIMDFSADMSGLEQQCFRSRLDIGSILEVHLLIPLLHQHSFQALKVFLQAHPEWFDANVVESCVLAYVREAALIEKSSLSFCSKHIETDRGKSIQNAIDCQDVLGPFFPNLHSEFDTMRRYLDAAHFMQNVLHCSSDSSLLDPATLHSTLPMRVVESVLAENQHSIVLDCADWTKPEFAAKANFDISRHFAPKDLSTSQEDPSKPEAKHLPPPPGGYVLQLAGILGLRSEYEQFVVMNLMIRRSLDSEWHGVAGALCATLLREVQADPTKAEGKNSTRTLLLLKSVADVVSAESYLDYRMRKELCVVSLGLFGGMISCNSTDVILRFFPILESQTSPYRYVKADTAHDVIVDKNGNRSSCHEDVRREGEVRTGEFLVFRAAGLVARRAKNIVENVKKSTDASQSLEILQDLFREHGGDPHGAFMQMPANLSTDVHNLVSSLHASIMNELVDGPSADQKINSNEATMQALARHVLLWCVSESTTIRTESITNSSVTGLVREMIRIGAAFLLEMQDSQYAQSILVDLQRKLETDASLTLEKLSQTAQPSSVIPDENIVRQLCGRGYSINGARRSVAMTNNESFSAALAWAIAHYTDDGFDLPLIYVKGRTTLGDEGFVDQKLMQLVRQSLQRVQELIKGKIQNVVAIHDKGQIPERSMTERSYPPIATATERKSAVQKALQHQHKAPLPVMPATTLDHHNGTQQKSLPPPPPPREDSKVNQAQVPRTPPVSQLPQSQPKPGGTMFRGKDIASPPPPPPPPMRPPNNATAHLVTRGAFQQPIPTSASLPLPPKPTPQRTAVPPPPPVRPPIQRGTAPPPPPPSLPPQPVSQRTTVPPAPLPSKPASQQMAASPPLKFAPQHKTALSPQKPANQPKINKLTTTPVRQNLGGQLRNDIHKTRENDGTVQTHQVHSSRSIHALSIPVAHGQGIPVDTCTKIKALTSPSESSLLSFEGSVSSRASLREKGEIVRKETKMQSTQLSAEERRKLAMEGRNFLEEARKARKLHNPPTTVIAPSADNTVKEQMFFSTKKRHKENNFACDEKIVERENFPTDETVPKNLPDGTNPNTKPTQELETDGWDFDNEELDLGDGYAKNNQNYDDSNSKQRQDKTNGDDSDWNFDDEDSILVDADENGHDERTKELRPESGVSKATSESIFTAKVKSPLEVDEGWDFDNDEPILQDNLEVAVEGFSSREELNDQQEGNFGKTLIGDTNGVSGSLDCINGKTISDDKKQKSSDISDEHENFSDGWDFDDF